MKLISEFDIRNAREAARYAELAYHDEDYIDNYLCHSCSALLFIDEPSTNTQCYIYVDDNKIIISFRGTKEIKDWLTNFQFCQISIYSQRINESIFFHEGFYNSYKSVSERIISFLKQNKGKPIFICSHSLGAAISNICAVDLHMTKGIQVTAVYGFGTPRVFDIDSAEYINSVLKNRIHRIVNNNDVVCHVPPEIIGSYDYSHIGTLAYFRENGELYQGKELNWWQAKQFALEGIISDIGVKGIDSIKDHSMSEYIKCLKGV